MNIYIPVWIDLKLYLKLTTKFQQIDLHSSMDRFEAAEIRSVFKNIFDLHSSMDRFKARCPSFRQQ